MVPEQAIQAKLSVAMDEFLNSSYRKQVRMYQLALEYEYYELLVHLAKLLPELPEEFLYDVDNLIYKP